jgi:hypothetical protein
VAALQDSAVTALLTWHVDSPVLCAVAVITSPSNRLSTTDHVVPDTTLAIGIPTGVPFLYIVIVVEPGDPLKEDFVQVPETVTEPTPIGPFRTGGGVHIVPMPCPR